MLDLPRTRRVINDGIERGLHAGVQLYVSQRRQVIADEGIGEDRPGIPLSSDTVMPWLSAGKPLTAVAVMRLVERGLITLETRIADVIPEFGQGGKHDVSLRHVLTHTSGFRTAPNNWPHSTWSETIAGICESPLEAGWVVGETAGYHVASSWYVLGELVQRLDGRSVGTFLREELAQPIGLEDTWNALPRHEWARYGTRIGIMRQREKGETRDLPWHDALHCEACSPGGNTRGPIRELGKFYECLLDDGEGQGGRLLQPESVLQMTSRQRIGRYDQTLQHSVDFGLGFIIDSKHYGESTVPYTYGRHCSPRTFGHGGSQSSIGFADPEHQLVVAYVANCRPGEGPHQRRNRQFVEAVYEDLGLSSADSASPQDQPLSG